MLLEGGLEELTSVPFDQLDSGDKDVKDDIDLRLKWLGLFHRRKQHCESSGSRQVCCCACLSFECPQNFFFVSVWRSWWHQRQMHPGGGATICHEGSNVHQTATLLMLLYRLVAADGRFMMRLKLPNGVTTSAQTRFLADVISKYGKDGCADITTRQNWQIRGVELKDAPEILKGMQEV